MTPKEIRAEHKRLDRERKKALAKAREAENAMRALMQLCEHPDRETFFCPDCGCDWSPDH